MFRYGFAVFLLALITAGCASKAPVDPRIAEVRAGVTSEMTSFDVHRKFQGPEHPLENFDGYVLIRSWQEPASPRAEHQLYVQVQHNGREKEFLSASEPGGELIDIKRIDTSQQCQLSDNNQQCSLYEDIGVWIETDTLRKAAKSDGIVLRLNAKRGEDVVVRVPTWYLKGYLSALAR